MKVFITGISGLIGQALAKSLVDRKVTVLGLTRDCDAAAKKLPSAVSLVDDLSSANDFLPDVVVNLAGAPIADKRWSQRRKAELFDSRVALTDRLVEWIKQLKHAPDCFISGSAVGYYGRHLDERLTEDGPIHDEFTHQLCQAWESSANQAIDCTRVCVIRTGLVVASQGGFLAKMLPPFRLGLGGRLGDGQQMMSWVHIADVVAAIEFLMADPQLSGPFNLTAPSAVSNGVFSDSLGQALNRPARLPMPAWVLRLMFGEMADLLLTGQAAYPEKLLASGFEFIYPELPEALAQAVE